MVLVDKMTMERLPRRPMSGGTNNGRRPARYDYWRVGYGSDHAAPLEFWVERAGEFHCKPGYVTGNFDHPDSTQLFFHLDGAATVLFEGGGRDLPQPVARGDILLAPFGRSFTYSGRSGLKYHWFVLGPSLHWPALFGAPCVRLLSPGYDAEVESRFTEIREALILRQPGYHLKAIGLVYELMARLEALLQPAPADSAYPEAVRNAIIFLRENLAAPFDAAATATAVNLSQSHLRALFEKWLGESPKQFHTRCRIEQARRLLKEQRLPVAETAIQVGFTDARYFSRVFRQMTGVPPSRYVGQQPGNDPPG